MKDLLQDLRWAIRGLAKRPAFSLVTITTLALAISANSAIFSVVNSLLLRPVPGVRAPERLVELSRDVDGRFHDLSHPVIGLLGESEDMLDAVAGFSFVPLAVSRGGEPRIIGGLNVTANYFRVLGVEPARGRFFLDDEAYPSARPVAVLSHDLWVSRFASRDSAIGAHLIVNGHPVEIIGVAPAGFGGHAVAMRFDLWIPLGLPIPGLRSTGELGNPDAAVLESIARLAPTVAAAHAQTALSARTNAFYSRERSDTEVAGYQLRVMPYAPVPGLIRGGVKAFFALLMAIMLMVLAIACVNVAGMLLSRTTERARELAIRQSLGADRRRLARLLLTETLVLFTAAAVAGLVFSVWLTGLIRAFEPPIPLPGIRLHFDLAPDLRVFAFSLALALIFGLAFGLAPALRGARLELSRTMGAAPAHGGRQRSGLRSALTSAQLAFTLVVLVATGLLVRSLHSRQMVDPGFETENIHAIGFNLELAAVAPTTGETFFRGLTERVRNLPGVETVSFARKLPLAGRSSFGTVQVAGVDPPAGFAGFDAAHNIVTADYFRTLGITILAGRSLPEDSRDTLPVAVINRTMAERLWPDGRAVGKHFTYAGTELEVVGVAENAAYSRLSEPASLFIYLPLHQHYNEEMTLLTRMRPDAAPPYSAIRSEVTALNAAVSVLHPQPLTRALEVHFLPQRLAAWISGVVGSFGLLLAMIGIYGATAHAASTRRREMGVRLALGARPDQIIGLVLREGMAAPLAGIALGFVAATLLTRFLELLLIGVQPIDPITFGAVIFTLLVTSALANALPARRAGRLDPSRVLRAD